MCGIGGLVGTGVLSAERLDALDQSQKHRGPDGKGRSVSQVGAWQVGLSHQRLAIIDLSDAGLQPMSERDAAGEIVFNGEIYNYLELRRRLASEGELFQTKTDTEVLLAALRRWGVETTLQRAIGMWAFAWLDRRGHRLVLARDRFGKKPLHIVSSKTHLAFASELRGIFALCPGRFRVNAAAVAPYLTQQVADHSPASFVEGVDQVPAGSYMSVALGGDALVAKTHRYYRIPREYEVDSRPMHIVTEELHSILTDAVRLRLRADVPLGVLVSGGVDSSAIAACAHAAKAHGQRLTLLTAVSEDPLVDERRFVSILNEQLGEPSELIQFNPEPEAAWRLLTLATDHNGAPIGSFSNVLQLEIMRKARDLGTTVLLSGQGADESACGYKKFVAFYIQSLLREGHFARATRVFAGFLRTGTLLAQFRVSEAKRYMPTSLRPTLPDVRGERLRLVPKLELGLGHGMALRDRQIADFEHLSIPILTRYEDRMGMAMSREVRNPFLDHRVVEFLLNLPDAYRIGEGYTKLALRRAVQREIPPALVWRRDKNGFELPEAAWLRGPLRSLLDECFSESSAMVDLGLVDHSAAKTMLRTFAEQRGHRGAVDVREVFSLCALEMWLRVNQANVA